MNFSISTILQSLIVFQSFFFATFLIFSNRGKKISNFLLAGLLILVGIQMSRFVIVQIGYTIDVLDSMNCAFSFVYGPFVYLYSLSLIYRDFKLNFLKLLHFLPFVIIVIMGLLNMSICNSYIYWFYLVSVISYVFLTFIEISKYRKVLVQMRSDYERINLSWLKLNILLFTVLMSMDLVQLFSNMFMNQANFTSFIEIATFFMLLIFISVMVFKGLVQPEIYKGMGSDDKQLSRLNTLKYANNKLSDTEARKLLEALEKYMQSREPYLEPSLNLNRLSVALDIPPRQLSQLINVYHGQNFLDYINSKRIAVAMKLLTSPTDEKETIQQVMYSVGFNSKSAFNNAFKKKTGVTPSVFKNQNTSK